MVVQQPIIVADIGGTNARFALATIDNGQIFLSKQHVFLTSNFSGLDKLVKAYQSLLIEQDCQYLPKAASLAVAGPVEPDGSGCLTNLPWAFHVNDLKHSTGLESLVLLNDFQAFAYAIPHLPQKNLLCLKEGKALSGAPISAVGAGTGFGVAMYLPQIHHVVPCEGGHQQISINNELQAKVCEYFLKFKSYVSVEDVLSGTGLPLLYQAWMKVHHDISGEPLSAQAITKGALEHKDIDCLGVIHLFCDWLAATLSDIVLTQGARGGVVLSGGVLPRWSDLLLHRKEFIDSFLSRVNMGYLKDVPIHLCIQEHAALLGAASVILKRA